MTRSQPGLNEYTPGSVTAPREFLREKLEEMSVPVERLAGRLSVSPDAVMSMIAGDAELTAEWAAGLERELLIPATFWINAERNYRDPRAPIDLSRVEMTHHRIKDLGQRELPIVGG